jgi:signal transduction histidine kinase
MEISSVANMERGDASLKKFLSSTVVHWTILALAVLIVIALAVTTIIELRRAVESRDLIVHTYDVRREIRSIDEASSQSRAIVLGLLLKNQRGESPLLDEQADRMTRAVSNLRGLVSDNPRQISRVDKLEPLVEQQTSELAECLANKGCTVSTLPEGLLQGRHQQKSQIDVLTDEMDREEAQLLGARLRTWDKVFVRNMVVIGVTLAFAVLLLFYIFHLHKLEIAMRKQMEKQALENAESYRALSARILELQDVERRKIARELHDSVGQFLAGLKMNLRQLESGKVSSSTSPEWLAESIEMADRALGEIRTISHLLHPPLLEELGFISTARAYLEEFSKRSGINVDLQIGEVVERFPRSIELALFRVLQESLTNVHRHAKAQKVNVNINCKEGKVILIVADDGKGIPPRILDLLLSGGAAGIGLSGMRERLIELQGTLEVASSPTGTTVRATLPAACDSEEEKTISALSASA